MQIVAAVCLALALSADVTLAKLYTPAQHPAGHLFARSAYERRTPVELYDGVDPQLAARGPLQDIKLDPSAKRSCTHDIYEFAPRHLKNEHGAMLTKRQATTMSPNTGTAYPAPGETPPAANTLPKAWVDKYQQVKKAGLIPNIPIAKEGADGLPSYPAGYDKKTVCSWTLDKCNDENIWQAPDDAVAFGVDDGPTEEGTPPYLQSLSKYNVSATHFLIGSAIYWNMPAMKQLANASPAQHLAVHTWSHSLQTIKTDMEVLGDLGWTMQIIYDVSGKIPMYFRPPEGDVDARVKSIAKYVFGMQTVMWTHDANDWCLRQGTGTAKSIDECVSTAPTLAAVRKVQNGWASATDSAGWITLNHETTDQASKAFSSLLRAAQKGQWNVVGNVADLQGLPWYNNAYGANDAATKQDNILPTKDVINVTDSTAAKGSSQAPILGNWANLAATENPAVGQQASSNSSSSSAKSATGSSIPSGAVSSSLVTLTFAALVMLSTSAAVFL